MIFRCDDVTAQWDTWCYHHESTYYLYYLITEHSPGEGFGVAVSSDGVHWDDQGWAIRESDQNLHYLGTGAVWKDPDFDQTGRFLCNYSEHRLEADGKRTQNILFAWSEDLIHWHKFGNETMFRVDDRCYDQYGRWDCIFAIPREEGGYWGTWTATAHPSSPHKGIVGIGVSDDGIAWTALPAPVVEPGVGESGAFCRFGNTIHAMFGAGGGMWAYSAETVTGPYTRQSKNAHLLHRGHSYFSRYFFTTDGVLVNHHVMSGKQNEHGRAITYAAPFKRAEVDDEGTQRWYYWSGNEALKGCPVALMDRVEPTTGVWITEDIDFAQGIVMEGTLRLPEREEPAVGILLEADGTRYAVRVLYQGRVEMALWDDAWDVLHQVDREYPFGTEVSFRLLARCGMLEFYLDDHFMECWTMGCADAQRVRLGIVSKSTKSLVGSPRVWHMSL